MSNKMYDLERQELKFDLEDGVISKAEYERRLKELKNLYKDHSSQTDIDEENIS